MLSSGGLAFTDLQHPTNTHRLAVAMMLMFTGIGTKAGNTARIARATSALVAGLFISASLFKTGLTAKLSTWSMTFSKRTCSTLKAKFPSFTGLLIDFDTALSLCLREGGGGFSVLLK